eukprot:3119511-Rhodomonas_salina.1
MATTSTAGPDSKRQAPSAAYMISGWALLGSATGTFRERSSRAHRNRTRYNRCKSSQQRSLRNHIVTATTTVFLTPNDDGNVRQPWPGPVAAGRRPAAAGTVTQARAAARAKSLKWPLRWILAFQVYFGLAMGVRPPAVLRPGAGPAWQWVSIMMMMIWGRWRVGVGEPR